MIRKETEKGVQKAARQGARAAPWPDARRRAGALPAIPAPYLRQMLELGRGWGLSEAQMLAGTRIQPELLAKPGARIAVDASALLALNVMRLCAKPGFGLDLGLHLKLTAHGQLGYAVLSAGTLREAAEIAYKYARARWSAVRLEQVVEGDTVAIHIVESQPLGPFRAMVQETMLTLLWRHACFIAGESSRDCELCFARPEPAYFAEYRERLPPVLWSQPVTALRFPLRYLDQPLALADAAAAGHALSEVERELLLLGDAPQQVVERVRAVLRPTENGFPGLEQVAGRLFMSSRTLKRKLQQSGASFQQLLNEALHQEALRLIRNHALDLQQIAVQLGYRDPVSFTRAFRRWTGMAPSDFRRKLMAAAQHSAVT